MEGKTLAQKIRREKTMAASWVLPTVLEFLFLKKKEK
jgi:hypothetical protein